MDNEGLNMKLIFLTLASFFFISSVSFAQTVGKQAEFNSALGVDYQSNLIKNPSAYKNAASVAVSSSSCIRGTTNKIDGKASWTVTTTALAGYCEFTLLVPSSEQTAGNCEYKGKFMGDGTLYSAQITDGSGNVLNSVNLTNETSWRDYSVTYPCAASGTRKVRITQTTAGTSPDLSVGKQYYGSITSLTQVTPPNRYTAAFSTAQIASNWTPTGSNWVTCSSGGTGVATCTFAASLGITSVPNMGCSVNSDNRGLCSIYSKTTSGFSISTLNESNPGTAANLSGSVWLEKTNADYVQNAITPNLQTQAWSGYGDGNAAAFTNTGYASMTQTGFALTRLSGSGGLNCTVISTNVAGITCSNPNTTLYGVCATHSFYSSGDSIATSFKLVDGNTTLITSNRVQGAALTRSMTLCGQVIATPGSPFTIAYQGKTSSGTSYFYTPNSDYPVNFSIWAINSTAQMPILTGGITSNANASLRTESASISNTGVVAEKFGVDWINGNCSLSDTSLFTCSFNSGTFSGDPDYTPSIVNSTVIGSAPQVKLSADATSSSGVFRTYYTDNVTDIAKYAYNFKVTCTGPR